VFGVVGVRGRWLEVTAEALPNGHHGWVEFGIGAPGSPTPTGRFAVAEKVSGPFAPAYGCFILALTARQPHLPPGWNTRITYYVAIHAGSGQGSAVSAGCLHVTDADVRYLMRTVPLGTPVQISP
jgi:lipoprotein-anchoring transpeptidase ErfK/SrfK